MGGPKTHYTRGEMISAQNRTEELFLELILERVLKHKPMSAVEYEAEDRQNTERGYPPTPEDYFPIIEAQVEWAENQPKTLI